MRFSASVSTWLQSHTATIAALAAVAVLAITAAAWRYHRATDHRTGRNSAADPDTAGCGGPETAEHTPPPVHAIGDRSPDGMPP